MIIVNNGRHILRGEMLSLVEMRILLKGHIFTFSQLEMCQKIQSAKKCKATLPGFFSTWGTRQTSLQKTITNVFAVIFFATTLPHCKFLMKFAVHWFSFWTNHKQKPDRWALWQGRGQSQGQEKPQFFSNSKLSWGWTPFSPPIRWPIHMHN